MPHSPPHQTAHDLVWWRSLLAKPTIQRFLHPPCPIIDPGAYSDASSEVGIGIIIGQRWCAWRLLPGWKSNGRDIGWAEAVGFLLLILIILPLSSDTPELNIYGDNSGVIEGWWKGRSRNRSTNNIFRLIHTLAEDSDTIIHT